MRGPVQVEVLVLVVGVEKWVPMHVVEEGEGVVD